MAGRGLTAVAFLLRKVGPLVMDWSPPRNKDKDNWGLGTQHLVSSPPTSPHPPTPLLVPWPLILDFFLSGQGSLIPVGSDIDVAHLLLGRLEPHLTNFITHLELLLDNQTGTIANVPYLWIEFHSNQKTRVIVLG